MKAQESTAVSDSNTNPVHPPNVEIETESLLPANDEKKAGDSREMWRMEEGGKRVIACVIPVTSILQWDYIDRTQSKG
jgi:hypothetical protein